MLGKISCFQRPFLAVFSSFKFQVLFVTSQCYTVVVLDRSPNLLISACSEVFVATNTRRAATTSLGFSVVASGGFNQVIMPADCWAARRPLSVVRTPFRSNQRPTTLIVTTLIVTVTGYHLNMISERVKNSRTASIGV